MPRFPIYQRPIERINGELYIVHAEYLMEKCKNTSLIKEWLGVEHAFKVHSRRSFIFCEKIEDVEWEEIT